MKMLVTAGGTKEFIDGVRYLGNISSGKTGAILADDLSARGHTVVWLGADSAIRPKSVQQQHNFVDYDDLSNTLKLLLSEHHFDAVFHAAAVSDYKLSKVQAEGVELAVNQQLKIDSKAEILQLTLIKQPKIINHLLHWSENKELKVIGFKLTNTEDPKQHRIAVNKLLMQPGIYAVAHNDLHAFNDDRHPFTLHVAGRDAFECSDIQSVVSVLMTLWEMSV